jgi:hypothetical protein
MLIKTEHIDKNTLKLIFRNLVTKEIYTITLSLQVNYDKSR